MRIDIETKSGKSEDANLYFTVNEYYGKKPTRYESHRISICDMTFKIFVMM